MRLCLSPAGHRSEVDAVQANDPPLLSVCRCQHGPSARASERTQCCELFLYIDMSTDTKKRNLFPASFKQICLLSAGSESPEYQAQCE